MYSTLYSLHEVLCPSPLTKIQSLNDLSLDCVQVTISVGLSSMQSGDLRPITETN